MLPLLPKEMIQKKHQKPKQEELIPTGDQLIDTLLFKGKDKNYDDMQEDDLYLALQNCKKTDVEFT